MDPFGWSLVKPDHELLRFVPPVMRRGLIGRSWSGMVALDPNDIFRDILALDGQLRKTGRIVTKREFNAVLVYPYSTTGQGLRPFMLTEVKARRTSEGTLVTVREALPEFMIGMAACFSFVLVAGSGIVAIFATRGPVSSQTLAGFAIVGLVMLCLLATLVWEITAGAKGELASARSEVLKLLGFSGAPPHEPA